MLQGRQVDVLERVIYSLSHPFPFFFLFFVVKKCFPWSPQVGETVKDITFLHNEMYFAAAQKKYVYIYDKRGLEIHCCRDHVDCSRLEFLPMHFLLCSVGETGVVSYQVRQEWVPWFFFAWRESLCKRYAYTYARLKAKICSLYCMFLCNTLWSDLPSETRQRECFCMMARKGE